eukprot:GFUD01016791.1.p1 GENE.GFUD01016791.1~~GFUD01016791.1.p1  ORF type:complete len:167 (+),score=22.98 GFUD01016791.1:99-599(+)
MAVYSFLAVFSILPFLASGRDQQKIGFTSSLGQVRYTLVKLGQLPSPIAKHPLNGTVYYRKDHPSVITISKLYYPIMGPDAFFWAGEDSPGCNDDSIGDTSYYLPVGKVGSTEYYSRELEILPAYDGTEKDVILRLPAGVTVRQLKWFCLWCRDFSVNFGQIDFDV